MTGTIINIIAVLVGGTLGLLLFGAQLPERLKATVVAGLRLLTAAIGIQMFLKTENAIIVLGALLIGALLGEWWKIEDGLQNLGRHSKCASHRAPKLPPVVIPVSKGILCAAS